MSELDFNVVVRNLPYLWQGLQLSFLLAGLQLAAESYAARCSRCFGCRRSNQSLGSRRVT